MIRTVRIVGEIAVITATADFHPLRQLKQVAEELEKRRFEGTVLFDLIAVNGLASNRFCSIEYARTGFDNSSFTIESNVNPVLSNEQDVLTRNDKRFLCGTVLSKDEVDIFSAK